MGYLYPFSRLGNRTTNYLLFSDLAHITDAPINGYPYPPGRAGVGQGWGMGGAGVGQGWGRGGAWVGQGWGFDTSHFQWPHTG